MHDPFDIDGLRIDPADPAYVDKARKPHKTKWQREFVRVPWSWVDRLKAASGISTYRVALFLLYEHWRNGRRPIRLSNSALISEGVTRSSKSRALQELEHLGLVKIKRRPQKSPMVTLKLIPKA
jgi:hypothetical protein